VAHAATFFRGDALPVAYRGFRDDEGSFNMPIAAKTGTTQNWADAWIIGYTPYYTTAIWFGFDMAGSSLGQAGTGAGLAGPVWGRYMREIHMGLPRRDFVRPETGIVYLTVCTTSGLLVTSYCDSGTVTLPFLTGTQPTRVCDTHGIPAWSTATAMGNIRAGTMALDSAVALGSFSMPTLPDDIFLMDMPSIVPPVTPPVGGVAPDSSLNLQPLALEPGAWGNPLLDEAPPFMGGVLHLPEGLGESVSVDWALIGASVEDDAEASPAQQGAQGVQEPPAGNPLLD